MTLERILQAAINSLSQGKRAPHCYSSHVLGKGYVGKSDDPDYMRQLLQSAQSEVDNMGYASGYAEPGYTDPAKGIVWANWNTFPRDLDRILEKAGYAVEWSDEWTTCEDCNKAVRTSPNSYGWQTYYKLIDDCSVICHDCMDWSSYLESIEDTPDQAVGQDVDPSEYGYERLSDSKEYESGFHRGQTDDPREILKALHATGRKRIVFRVLEVSQFYVTFETWQKIEEEETGDGW